VGVYTLRTLVLFGVEGVSYREKARSAPSALTMNTEPLIWREVRAPPARGLFPTLAAPAGTAPPEVVA
jgi:hypothetical protein